MRKIIGLTVLLIFGIFLVGCGDNPDKDAVDKIYGKIIIAEDVTALNNDFKLSTTTNAEGVKVTWSSTTDKIKIETVKETSNGTEVEYFMAKVTLSPTEVTGTLTAKLEKGKESREWTQNVRIAVANTPANEIELTALADDALVNMNVTLKSTGTIDESRGAFNPTFTDKDGKDFIGYRISDDHYDAFKALEGKEVSFLGIKGSYQGKGQITSIVWIKAA